VIFSETPGFVKKYERGWQEGLDHPIRICCDVALILQSFNGPTESTMEPNNQVTPLQQ